MTLTRLLAQACHHRVVLLLLTALTLADPAVLLALLALAHCLLTLNDSRLAAQEDAS